jgi:hypothetical protein
MNVPSLLADVSFGIFALMPLGWAFMALIIILEVLVMSRVLTGRMWQNEVAAVTILANVASGAVGFGLSLLLNGGWWLVVWMPWVSNNEVRQSGQFGALAIYYVLAFGLSMVIEGIIEQLMLKRRFGAKKVWKSCLFANVASYFFGSVVLYSWSFGLWK